MRNKSLFLFIVFAVLVGIIFIITKNRSDKEKLRIEETRINAHNQYVQDSLQKVDANLAANLSEQKKIESAINENKIKQKIEAEKFKSYINSSITNSNSTDVSVTIVDENGNIASTVSNAIANVYNKSGTKANTSLLRSSFIHEPIFQELFEANSDIITKLKLDVHTDYLAIGKISYIMSEGTLVNGTKICTSTITMHIISTNSKTLVNSFTFSANGNGITESQAKEEALRKLMILYNNDYSSI